jgi:selenocysteine lyase/cysteine desulfurase
MLTTASRLQDFPSLSGIAYLNTAAESIPPLCVKQALDEYWHDKTLGMKGRDGHFARVEQCREISARMIGMKTREVSFCSCSSEAYNLLATALDLKSSDEVVVSDLDFPAGATPWLTARVKPAMRVWKSRDGALDVADLKPLLNEQTKLVQLSLVSFYNGHRIAWDEASALVRQLAPNAVLAVDVTQALGRIVFDCTNADIIISSTHKWTLGIHGGCIVGIAGRAADRLTTTAGGWYHLANAFDADRFDRAVMKHGAASYSVGMPSFAPIYALNASLRYLETIGVSAISAHADPLVQQAADGLTALGIRLMAAIDQTRRPTGIIAFQHPETARIHAALESSGVHVMHHAGRIRIAIHGYNTSEDIARLVGVVAATLT